ncbi:nuclear transport factor 2 family protein [Actinomadura sp. LD22]|uniref:Nuclear transport factor 2 family protein n=1 Tax=Actinomadura physcomitrii TaxID=2650748 RepID=A0A6I4MAE9_9ACTN|nr:nuclear transport factor 2 family protein [Actinomadura physcomitrii]MWA03218.1 nuclear transport factor 2 family protein [Actinomadura physcomitrii]
MTSELERRVQLIWDRQEIERVLRRYCRAIDRLDLDLLRSVYHPDATDAHGTFEGDAHEFAEFIVDRIRRQTSYGFHTVTNAIIEVDGDRATSESSYFGYHRIPGGWDSVSAFFGEGYAASAKADGALDQEHEYVCGGRYLDRFARRDGTWRILRRRITNEWNQCRPSAHLLEGGRAAYDLPGARDRTDPVYDLTLD